MNKKGTLAVVSGFSGSGKGTVLRLLKNKYSNYKISISYTTRNKREGEQEGVDYFYKTDEEFEQMIERNGFLEYAGFVGRYYGTPKDMVDKWLSEGYDVILEIEVNGAMQVIKNRPDAAFIFIMPPSADELRRRLYSRGREKSDEISARFKQAGKEIEYVSRYQYIVENDLADDCADKINDIIQTVKGAKESDISLFKSDTEYNIELINKFRSGLNGK